MPTLFYKSHFSPELPITFLFTEHLMAVLQGIEPQEREEKFVEVVALSLQVCGVTKGAPTEEELVSVIERLNEQALKEREEDDLAIQGGRNFAGYFIQWAGKLHAEALTLFLADYDFERARRYYCELDQQAVIAIASERLRLEFERARVSFEAALFGFGGSYKGSPKDGDADFDLTKDNATAEVMLKNFGF